MVFYYDGHTHELKDGGISHKVIQPSNEIQFSTWVHEDLAIILKLTTDQAFKLGLSLLRDVSLARYGVG
jgi:hypothetical protein